MDTVTQAMFGAVIGQAGFQRKLGWRALAAGAAVATLPDLDVLMVAADPLHEWRYHRGITHSVFFGPVVGVALGWTLWRGYRWRNARAPSPAFERLSAPEALGPWIWLCVLALFTHPFLDVLTPYGTQLLAPFTDQRFAVNAMSIIDPVYTGILLAALTGAYVWRAKPRVTASLGGAAIVGTVMWQTYAWSINLETEQRARAALAEQGVATAQVISYPTLFQPWYRRITAETDDAIRVGFSSPLVDTPIEWQTFSKPESPLILELARTAEYRVLERFALGQIAWKIVPGPNGDTRVEAHDLRYIDTADGLQAYWGVAASFDGQARLLDVPARFSTRPVRDSIFRDMWVGAFGE